MIAAGLQFSVDIPKDKRQSTITGGGIYTGNHMNFVATAEWISTIASSLHQ